MSQIEFNGCKVFSATKARERDLLGEQITEWIRANPQYRVVDRVVAQSSDSEFHCLSITLFYVDNPATAQKPSGKAGVNVRQQ